MLKWFYDFIYALLKWLISPQIHSGFALLSENKEERVRVLCDWPLRNTELNLPKDVILNPELKMDASAIFILEVTKNRFTQNFSYSLFLTPTPEPKMSDIDDEIDNLFLETLKTKYPKSKMH